MEVKSFQIDKFITKPSAAIVAALVFGPDQGLVRERATVLTRSIVPDLDPFRVSDIDETRITSDPACLRDEAASFSMFGGGRRVIRIRGAGNGLAAVMARVIAEPSG